MKKIIVACLLFAASMSAMAFGEVGRWSSGWGQGVSEYIAIASKGNTLYIACSEGTPVSMILTVNGVEYGSYGKKAFNLVIDGREIETPYETSSHAEANIFNYVWQALRKAKTLQAKTSDGKTLVLPVIGAAKALPAQGKREYACKTDF